MQGAGLHIDEKIKMIHKINEKDKKITILPKLINFKNRLIDSGQFSVILPHKKIAAKDIK